MYQNRENVKNILLYFVDIIMVFISYVLGNLIWLEGIKRISVLNRADLFENLGIVLFFFFFLIFIFNNNRDFFKRVVVEELLYCFKINVIFASFYAIVLFIKGDMEITSRGVYVVTVLLNVLFMLVSHLVIKFYLIRIYQYKKKNIQMFVITTKDRAEGAVRRLQADSTWMKRIYGMAIIDDIMIGEEILGIPIKADFNSMVSYVKDEAVDEVFINVPYDTGNSLRNLIMEFENMGVVVHLDIEIAEKLENFNKSFSMLGEIPVITFANNYYDSTKIFIKRVMDIVGSIVGIVITLIVMVFLAPILLIESPGPLIFKQKRVGRNGRYFYIYKFRSMYKDAEERKKQLLDQNEMKGHMFKMTDDPRITKVGKFIRKTSIDELPQFFNVFMGDMSLVGTRPPTVDEFKQYESYHKRRLSMNPGITGMWQVSGRSNIEDFEEVVKLDLKYIDNWSIGLDIKILFKTVGAVFKRGGAR